MNDRFIRGCRREPVDATPVWFMRQAGRSLPEYRAIRERAGLVEITHDPALCAEVTIQPVRRLGVDAAVIFADITSPLPGMGIEMEIVDGVGPVIANPIRTAEAIDGLRAFDPAASVPGILEAIGIVAREAGVPAIGFAGAPFTLATYLVDGKASREAATTKTLMRRDPALFARLLDRIADMTITYLAAQVAAGASAVQLFDSWAGSLAPADFRRHVAPHTRRILEAASALGVPTINFGTGTAGFIADVAAAGGDVIGLDWRIEMATARRILGDRAVQGNLDPTALLGPWEGVAADARTILAAGAVRPGHVFNLGHGVLPETDPEHLRRLVDLVHEWRPAA